MTSPASRSACLRAPKRGIGAGTRMMLTQTGFVVSIALAIGLVTSAMDPSVLVAIFSGTQVGSSGINLAPFINALTSLSLPASS